MSRGPAARMGDTARHDTAHCHASIHMIGGRAGVVPHAPQPLALIGGSQTVKINGQFAARAGDTTAPCQPPGCVPSAGGKISGGSTTVMINGMPAARAGDVVSFAGCGGPVPCLTGKLIVGSPTVTIG
ncbi:MAG: PAAR domain-containing protein [Gemmatimonadaceae bacterium]